jgi:excisionase family DNA binding protein
MSVTINRETLEKVVQPLDEVVRPLEKVVQVATRLGISRAFVYQLMDRGDLPYVQLGGTRRVRPEDVDRLVADNTKAGK